MFQGFTDQTLAYFLQITLENSRTHFDTLREDYNNHVKTPLRALHDALVPILLGIDKDICVKPARCVSGAYNDARFSRSEPMKTYMYLHFLAETSRETDVPGFFFDASYNDYRYGLQLYHATSAGMRKLRDAVLFKSREFSRLAESLERSDGFTLEGEFFKRDRFPDAPPELKKWLNRKRWWLGRTKRPDADFFSPALVQAMSEGFLALGALYHFMKEGLL
jgi:uncharacterized protein (DUF2461 family)